jgi:hypothetical protein
VAYSFSGQTGWNPVTPSPFAGYFYVILNAVASRTVLPYDGSNSFPPTFRGTITANGTTGVTGLNPNVKSYSNIILNRNSTGVTGAPAFVSSVLGGTGFTIVNTVPDTSTYNYMIM